MSDAPANATKSAGPAPEPPHARQDAPTVSAVRDAAGDVAAGGLAARAPLAALLAGQVLNDGELIVLLLKPSRWYVILSSLRWIAAAAIVAIGGWLAGPNWFGNPAVWPQLFGLFALGRITWAVLHWMGRYYVLTDMRIVRLSGVFHVDVAEHPLRRLSGARLYRSTRERVTGRGTIEVVRPDAADAPHHGVIPIWTTISRPHEVLEVVQRTIARVNSNGDASGNGAGHA
jgi:hypothetical protein